MLINLVDENKNILWKGEARFLCSFLNQTFEEWEEVKDYDAGRCFGDTWNWYFNTPAGRLIAIPRVRGREERYNSPLKKHGARASGWKRRSKRYCRSVQPGLKKGMRNELRRELRRKNSISPSDLVNLESLEDRDFGEVPMDARRYW